MLDESSLISITKLLLKDVITRLRNNKIKIVFTDDVYEFLISKRDNEKFGARPIKRVITKYIENKIADSIINNDKIVIKSLKVIIKNDEPQVKVLDSTPINVECE